MIWTEKYRPESLDDLIGQPSKVINPIKNWASKWKEKTPKNKGLLIAGKTGVGKTTAAKAISNEFNFNLVELNAGDVRTYKGIMNNVKEASNSLDVMGNRNLILFDEVDELDRGGSRAVTELLKKSKNPIVMTAKNKWEVSSGIRNNSKNITLWKVRKGSIRKHLRGIAKKEGIEITNDQLNEIAEKSNGDVRAAINDLQGIGNNTDLLPDRNKEKDVFSTLDDIFTSETFEDAKRAVSSSSENPDDLMAWIEHNIPIFYKNLSERSEAINNLSRADIFFSRARIRGHYNLWRYAIGLMSGGVGLVGKGNSGRFKKPKFFGKYKTKERSRNESIQKKIGKKTHTSTKTAREYLPYLKLILEEQPENGEELTKYFEFDEKEVKFLSK